MQIILKFSLKSVLKAIFGDYVVFAAKNGMIYAYSKTTGLQYWSKNVKATYFPEAKFTAGIICDNTPVRYLNSFLIGVFGYGYIVRADIATGALIGKVSIHSHPLAKISMSGTVFGNSYFVGVSSTEEAAAASATYKCCSFVGTFSAINIPTMTIAWTWSSIPTALVAPGQYSGIALWGSSPAIDTTKGVVYFGTGNNYFVPPNLQACYTATPKANWETKCNQILAPNNWFESVVALNTATGAVVWAKRFTGYDAWTDACATHNINCPFTGTANDADFDMAPVLSSVGGVQYLFIGQKSGVVYCLNAATGAIVWQTAILVTSLGALAVDETNVYVNVPNISKKVWTLKSGAITTGGGWAALNKGTGAIVWTTPNPKLFSPNSAQNPPITVAGDVVLSGSHDGIVYALNKATGLIVSSYNTLSAVDAGFAVDINCAYIGNSATLYQFC